jgi:arsenical pump membrane protein
VGAVVGHLAGPSLAAVVAGWVVHRRRLPTRLKIDGTASIDRRALYIGGAVVSALLVGFVAGPSVGIQPWMVAVAADAVLMVVVRDVPWRHVPLATAVGVAVVAEVLHLVVPHGLHLGSAPLQHPAGVVGLVAGGAALANVVNNLPALFAGLAGAHHMTWALWAWLLGINCGAVLLPVGALANLLWRRVVSRDGIDLGLGAYVRLTAPAGLAGLGAAAMVLVIERLLWS